MRIFFNKDNFIIKITMLTFILFQIKNFNLFFLKFLNKKFAKKSLQVIKYKNIK